MAVLALALALGLSSASKADSHYFPLSTVFTKGKCTLVNPNFERMVTAFAGGEITEYKKRDENGHVTQIITSVVNKERDQWAIVGSRASQRYIFCLYASGVGEGVVDKNPL